MPSSVAQTLLDPAFQKEYAKYPPDHRAAFEARVAWLSKAHRHQILPKGDWYGVWMLLAGRGAGKTRTAAEEIWWRAWSQPKTRWLVSAPTSADCRSTCFEGDSGILNVMPPVLLADYNKSLGEIWLTNNSLIKAIPASEPSRFRGPQFHGAWLDELAAWDYLAEAWEQIQFNVRLGQKTLIIATTTPRPKDLIVDLVNRDGEDVCVTTASTYANLDNLSPSFRAQILQFEGTGLGRQEIHAEILDPEEGGIVKRSWFKLWPADRPLPQFEYVVQSYDCATSTKTANDPTACVVLGVFRPGPDSPMSAMLIDCWSERMQYPELRPKVIDEASVVYGDENEFGNGKKVDLILIEDKSAGISLIQDLQRANLPVRSYNPGNADKAMRLNIVAPLIARGRLYLPESGREEGYARDWCDQFLNQVCSFPDSKHDDYVDALSQALRMLRDMGFLSIDPNPSYDDDYDERPKRVNPYAV
jgi:predicted phage terminase large subunit-like protein